MKNFLKGYVLYWFESAWKLPLAVLLAIGITIYALKINEFPPVTEIIFFIWAIFLLWYLPSHYVYKKKMRNYRMRKEEKAKPKRH